MEPWHLPSCIISLKGFISLWSPSSSGKDSQTRWGTEASQKPAPLGLSGEKTAGKQNTHSFPQPHTFTHAAPQRTCKTLPLPPPGLRGPAGLKQWRPPTEIPQTPSQGTKPSPNTKRWPLLEPDLEAGIPNPTPGTRQAEPGATRALTCAPPYTHTDTSAATAAPGSAPAPLSLRNRKLPYVSQCNWLPGKE